MKTQDNNDTINPLKAQQLANELVRQATGRQPPAP